MKKILPIACLAAIAANAPAHAEPTEVVVRVISEDAKFIGDSMGGAAVILRDAESGRVLAKGKTSGGTGNTARIMQASGRSPLIATSDAAAFVARIDIDQPWLVNLEVSGPVNRPGSKIKIVSQRWIMPGQPVNTGDGWVVELLGLAIRRRCASSRLTRAHRRGPLPFLPRSNCSAAARSHPEATGIPGIIRSRSHSGSAVVA